uniref:AlNc14C156G7642 protein n=1 Tax=Albugo laibachii Nc14 TaxID=890382 RepID=F0WME5_9STRA|nr:AlNc14C156G7642 [Albugo laibachii Nc14]|eukprot:CCA22477.1 AlNc14C156G7642 [Albugo laibachii Nc14]
MQAARWMRFGLEALVALPGLPVTPLDMELLRHLLDCLHTRFMWYIQYSRNVPSQQTRSREPLPSSSVENMKHFKVSMKILKEHDTNTIHVHRIKCLRRGKLGANGGR